MSAQGAVGAPDGGWPIAPHITEFFQHRLRPFISRADGYLTATQRVALAHEARFALGLPDKQSKCVYCAEMKGSQTCAMAPSSEHTLCDAKLPEPLPTPLPAVLVDLAHRVASFAGSITAAYYAKAIKALREAGYEYPEPVYIEVVCVAIAVTMLDTFYYALAAPIPALPAPDLQSLPHPVNPETEYGPYVRTKRPWAPFIPYKKTRGDLARFYKESGYDSPFVSVVESLNTYPSGQYFWAAMSDTFYVESRKVMTDFTKYPNHVLDRAQIEALASIERVPCSTEIIAYVHAVAARDPTAITKAQLGVSKVLTPAAVAEVAGIIANFHANTRQADATGLQGTVNLVGAHVITCVKTVRKYWYIALLGLLIIAGAILLAIFLTK